VVYTGLCARWYACVCHVRVSVCARAGTKALAADVLHVGQPVFFPTVEDRLARWRTLCPGSGVVELQVNFPSPVRSSGGEGSVG
jgi:hypothetical protein